MGIDTATAAGSAGRPNEDFVGTALPAFGRAGPAGVLVLLDGVTPPPSGTWCRHGVPWFVARLGGAMIELSASRPDLTLRHCLALAIARTADAHRGTCDLSHRDTPQSTVVAARWDGERVEHLVLSDSVLLVEDPAGTVRPVLDERLHHLPEPVGRLRAEARALPDGSAERAAAWAVLRTAIEDSRNAEGGFFTAAADPAVAERAVHGERPQEAVRALAALSDGASRLVDVFHATDWTGAFRLLRAEGCEAFLRRVRAAERADPDGTRHPRGKPHDDATAALAVL